MRLSPSQVETIKRMVRAACGQRARVRLFGSQVDDRRRGGDIDLLVEVEGGLDLDTELRLQRELSEALDDRKVDLVVHDPGRPPQPIVRIAPETGVIL